METIIIFNHQYSTMETMQIRRDRNLIYQLIYKITLHLEDDSLKALEHKNWWAHGKWVTRSGQNSIVFWCIDLGHNWMKNGKFVIGHLQFNQLSDWDSDLVTQTSISPHWFYTFLPDHNRSELRSHVMLFVPSPQAWSHETKYLHNFEIHFVEAHEFITFWGRDQLHQFSHCWLHDMHHRHVNESFWMTKVHFENNHQSRSPCLNQKSISYKTTPILSQIYAQLCAWCNVNSVEVTANVKVVSTLSIVIIIYLPQATYISQIRMQGRIVWYKMNPTVTVHYKHCESWTIGLCRWEIVLRHWNSYKSIPMIDSHVFVSPTRVECLRLICWCCVHAFFILLFK